MIFSTDLVAKRCIQAAIFTSAVLTSGFWGNWDVVIWSWILCYPLAIVYGFVFANVMSLFGAEFVDDDVLEDEEAHDESLADVFDEEGSSIHFREFQDNEGTVFSDDVVGLYKGKTIHEWVMVNDPDNPEALIKCEYYNCVELGKDLYLPPDAEYFALMDPGILYVKRHDPECDQHEDQEEA